MSVEFEGLGEILDSIDSFADWEKVQAGIEKACAIVERSAKQKAPKGNGELRRSITSKVDGTVGMVFTPLEYAPYVEYGTGLFAENGGRQDVPWNYQDDEGNWHSTSGMKPHPYMRPALYENREEILRIIAEGMQND
jgi:HK97 gp10 family phage protein